MPDPLPYYSPLDANLAFRRLRNTILLGLWGLIDILGGTLIAALCMVTFGDAAHIDRGPAPVIAAAVFLLAALALFFWGVHTLRLAHSVYTHRPDAARLAYAACCAAQAVTLTFLSLLLVPALWWSISIRAVGPLLTVAVLFLIFAPALSLTRHLLKPLDPPDQTHT